MSGASVVVVAAGAARAGSQHALAILAGESGALREVFRAGVRVAAESGLVGLICHAVDGTKIRAASSPGGVEHRPQLERALGRVEASIQAMEQAVEDAEARQEGEYRLPEGLQGAEKLRQAIRASLGRMQEAKRDHLHPCEPEARMMPCADRKEMAYNAQVVVDEASELIVAEEVVNEESGNRRLVPMLDEVKANLGEVAEATVADGVKRHLVCKRSTIERADESSSDTP